MFWGGSNYRLVIKTAGDYTLPDGRVICAERVYPSKSKQKMAQKFANLNGFEVIKVQVGPENMITSRVDWLILKEETARKFGLTPFKNDDWDFTGILREEIYSNDNH